MKVVKVYGALRERLGQCRFEFDVATPVEALKALIVNFPGLEQWLLDNERDGVSFRVMVGKEKIQDANVHELAYPWSSRDVFSIAPVISGAGGSATQIGIGIGLIAVSFLFPGAGLFGTTSIFGAAAGTAGTSAALTTLGTVLSGVGASLVLGGIAQAISPTPTMSPLERGREAARLESFSFSGIVNTAQQGLPVPICYGRCFVGSAVISSGLDVVWTGNSSTSNFAAVEAVRSAMFDKN
jgi:predicted phage tail protein